MSEVRGESVCWRLSCLPCYHPKLAQGVHRDLGAGWILVQPFSGGGDGGLLRECHAQDARRAIPPCVLTVA